MAVNNNLTLDALIPAEMAAKAEAVGVSKARLGKRRMFLLAVLAGSFIGLGAIFATTVAAGSGEIMPYGITRLMVGIVFSLGLILVIVGGAELFTGNNLIVMAWANQKIKTRRMLRNWIVVYLGNFIGSIATAGLLFLSGQYQNGGGAVGAAALTTANAKAGLGFLEALVLGVLCNTLVCLAVWLTFSARTTSDKIMAIIPPIAAFVAAGFEHSVANMYFIPVGLFIKSGASPEFWASIGKTAADYADLTWMNFFFANLVPVTLGNIVGGTLFVGGVYWFLFLRTPRNP